MHVICLVQSAALTCFATQPARCAAAPGGRVQRAHAQVCLLFCADAGAPVYGCDATVYGENTAVYG
eukprot:2327079-Rhodomonas_salina.5